MKIDPDDTLATHLTKLKAHAGVSMSVIAKGAGYAGRSSIQRYFTDHTIDRLDPDVASKFAAVLVGKGTPPIGLEHLARLVTTNFDDAMQNIGAIAHLLKLHGSDLPLQASSVEPVRSGMLPVMGTAQASNWMERTPSLDEPETWLAIPFHSYQPQPGQYALRIVGPSLNLIAPEGHYAICQKYGEAPQKAPNGKYVHVERTRDDFVEWTVKRVKWDADGMILCPHSDHPDHQAPIHLGDPGHNVRIMGLVTGWYAPA
jgi:SOS-response transcriptional repressor LexA